MSFKKRTFLSHILFISIIFISVNSWGLSVDVLNKSVVFIEAHCQVCEKLNGKKKEVWYKDPNTKKDEPKLNRKTGTAFIVRHNGKDYLVTAKHVVDCLLRSFQVTMNLPSGESIRVSSRFLESLKVISGAKWFFHPSADIAIHPLAYHKKVDHVNFISENCPKKNKKLPLLSKVYVLGFPQGLGIGEVLSPLAKAVRIAGQPDHNFIFLDQALCQGYSGAPVFYIEDLLSKIRFLGKQMPVGEKIQLIGLVKGTISDNTGGKISAVVPISYLWDIFQLPNFLAYEQALNKSHQPHSSLSNYEEPEE